jgi:hypothetical protein
LKRELFARFEFFFLTSQQKWRARPKIVDFFYLNQFPENSQIGIFRTPVIKDYRGSERQAGHEKVPHHPTSRGVPEEFVSRPEIQVQGQRLEVFQQNAAMSVRDRLRHTRRSRRIQDPKRMIERHSLETKRCTGLPGTDEV